MEKVKYAYRFLARSVIEAVTPLAIGSGDNNIQTDALVVLDVNGLPYIPGTSLAGVFRHAVVDESKDRSFFGYSALNDLDNGMGSLIIFTEARMVGKDGVVIDGLRKIDFEDDFYSYFKELPIRQHVRINNKGVAKEGGKFDEQIVFKGTRFCFEIEMVSDGNNWGDFEKVLKQMRTNNFRIGGKTRSGFGEINVISCQTAKLNLENDEDLKAYLNKSSSLVKSASWDYWTEMQIEKGNSKDFVEYTLALTPVNFFLFGSGIGDADADITPVKAIYINWEKGTAQIEIEALLIPGASIKGALAHRVAYYYNKLKGFYIGNPEAKTGSENTAVNQIFGFEGRKKGDKTIDQRCGNILISDIIEKRECVDKILNHVAIDRFTGGAMDGALFSEKTTFLTDKSVKKEFVIKLLLKNESYEKEVVESLEAALKDICKGILPLGGGVNRGNGCFEGKLSKDGNLIYEN